MSNYEEKILIRHFGDPGGFSRVSNTLVRLYTQLDGFSSDVVGLYAYLRSWRNTTDPEMLNIVWHSREYLYLQSGLGRRAFDTRLKVLEKYGLVNVFKSKITANKDYFVINDPLERDEFIARFSEEVAGFFKKRDELEKKTQLDRERRQQIEREHLTEQLHLLEKRRADEMECPKSTD